MPEDTQLLRAEPSQQLTLQAQDPALHPMIQHVLAHRSTTGMSRFIAGAKLPLMSFRLLLGHRELWSSVFWPIVINLTLFAFTLYFFLTQGSALFSSAWAKPALLVWYDWLLALLWYLSYALTLALAGVLAYVSSMVVGGVLASPFNDALSDKTERILLGERFSPGPEEPFIKGMLKSALSSAITASLYIGVMGPLLLLNLIPGIGSVAYTLIGGVVGGYFLALEYSDTLLARRDYSFKRKLELVYAERPFTIGFGVGTSLSLAIPLLNFFCLPLAVMGGTAVGLGLEQWDGQPARAGGEELEPAARLAAEDEQAP